MPPIRTTDYHTAGEPFRIVTGGGPEVPGRSVLDRRVAAAASPEAERVRELLVREPRGHADMYGCFLVPPDDDGAHLGVLFWHQDGYSTACGHGTIALGAWAVQSGRVSADPDGETEVVLDVPSGRVTARVRCRAGVVRGVVFRNVGAYPVARGVKVRTSRGPVRVDLGWGGALYASVAADAVGLRVQPSQHRDLVALGREVKAALRGTAHARHRSDPRLDGVYGVTFYEDLGRLDDGPWQRNLTVFADGEVDRSPCGSGTSARLALLADEGRLGDGRVLRHDSVIGTTFRGRVVAAVVDGVPGEVVTEIEGMAHRTGTSEFTLDPDDPLGTGFVLR